MTSAPSYSLPLPAHEGELQGYLVLSTRLHLSEHQARTLLAQNEILDTGHQADLSSEGSGYYWSAHSPVPQARVNDFLVEFAAARRHLNCSLGPEVRECSQARRIFYFGHEVLRLDTTTGCIHSHPSFPKAKVSPKPLELLRNDIGRLWLVRSLCDEFALSTHDVVVPRTQSYALDSYWDRMYSPRGRESVSLRPGGPSAIGALGRAQSVIAYKLFPRENFAVRAAQFTRLIWRKLLDSTTANLTARSVRQCNNFAFEDYNQVALHRQLYEQVAKDLPKLLPMLHLFIQHQPLERRWPTTEHVKQQLATDFFALRRTLMSVDLLSKSDWKSLVRVPAREMKALMDEQLYAAEYYANELSVRHGGDLSNLIPEPQLPLALAMVLKSFSHTRSLGVPVERCKSLKQVGSRLQMNDRVYRVEPEEQERRETAARRVLELLVRHAVTLAEAAPKTIDVHLDASLGELASVTDWLLAEGFELGLPDSNSTWESLRRRSAVWHEEGRLRAERDRKQREAARTRKMKRLMKLHANPDGPGWNPRMQACVIDGVDVRPLHTSEMLNQEADEQDHCVWSYDEYCWEGDTLIFSLRDLKGENRSTLEVRGVVSRAREKGKKAPVYWGVEQLMAAYNQDPCEKHAHVAQQIAQRLTAQDAV